MAEQSRPGVRLAVACFLVIVAGTMCLKRDNPSSPATADPFPPIAPEPTRGSAVRATPSATGNPERAKVLVSWTTESAEGLYGFVIYRGVSPGGPWTRVNPTPVLAGDGGMTPTRQDYRYVDDGEDVRIGQTYYYWLEAVDNDGGKRRVWWPPKSVVAKVRLDEEFPSRRKD